MISPALQRGEYGFRKFVTESRRDVARTILMQKPIKPMSHWEASTAPFDCAQGRLKVVPLRLPRLFSPAEPNV